MNYKISEKWSFWGFVLGLFSTVLAIFWISYNLGLVYKKYKAKQKAKLGLGKAMNVII